MAPNAMGLTNGVHRQTMLNLGEIKAERFTEHTLRIFEVTLLPNPYFHLSGPDIVTLVVSARTVSVFPGTREDKTLRLVKGIGHRRSSGRAEYWRAYHREECTQKRCCKTH